MILVPVLSLLELMVASQSVDMFSPMPLRLVCSFARVVVMSELPRFRILPVSNLVFSGFITSLTLSKTALNVKQSMLLPMVGSMILRRLEGSVVEMYRCWGKCSAITIFTMYQV